MKPLAFSYNWNNKLNCKAFTTLRLSDRYQVGDRVPFSHQDQSGLAEVIAKKELKLDQINDFIAYLDTGYSVQECKDVLRRMYKNRNINWDTQPIYLYLLKKL